MEEGKGLGTRLAEPYLYNSRQLRVWEKAWCIAHSFKTRPSPSSKRSCSVATCQLGVGGFMEKAHRGVTRITCMLTNKLIRQFSIIYFPHHTGVSKRRHSMAISPCNMIDISSYHLSFNRAAPHNRAAPQSSHSAARLCRMHLG